MERVSNNPNQQDPFHAEIIFRLSQIAEYRDPDTPDHLQRISLCSQIVARHMGWSDREVALIGKAATMHDIGKIGVPESILFKPGPLTADEFALMNTHTTIGAKILGGSNSPLIQMAERIALSHHERWDGSGYPQGLSGEDIAIEGRIVSVVDVFDALVGERCYKGPLSVEKSVEVLRESAEGHFDPAIVEAFLSNLDEILGVYGKAL